MLMGEIQERIQYANLSHEEHTKQTKEFEQRVEEIKSNLKVAMEGDMPAGDFADVDFGFDSANKKGYYLHPSLIVTTLLIVATIDHHHTVAIAIVCSPISFFLPTNRRGKVKGPGAPLDRLRRR